MDEITKKNAIVRAMTEIECYPVIQDEVATQEYTKIPLGQLSQWEQLLLCCTALKNVFNGVKTQE